MCQTTACSMSTRTIMMRQCSRAAWMTATCWRRRRQMSSSCLAPSTMVKMRARQSVAEIITEGHASLLLSAEAREIRHSVLQQCSIWTCRRWLAICPGVTGCYDISWVAVILRDSLHVINCVSPMSTEDACTICYCGQPGGGECCQELYNKPTNFANTDVCLRYEM